MACPAPRLLPLTLTALSAAVLLPACTGGSSGTSSGIRVTSDPDGDGLPDYLERQIGSDPRNPDDPYVGGDQDLDTTDGPAGDGIPDGLEKYLIAIGTARPITTSSDLDLDGIPDYLEVRTGSAVDDSEDPFPFGAADILNDYGPPGDGIPDGLERFLVGFGAKRPVSATTDSDRDGLPDVLEVRSGSDPFDSRDPRFGSFHDVDHDGIPDYFEQLAKYDPYNGDIPVVDGGNDADGGVLGPDGDGISDALEFALVDQGATPPITARTDSDGDGLPDTIEVLSGSNPFDGDSPLVNGGQDTNDSTGPAGDGISDAVEYFLTRNGPSSRITSTTDSDKDTIPDWLELLSGTNPFVASDPPAFQQADVDGDGVLDVLEVSLGSDPLDPDSPVVDGANDDDDTTGPPGDVLSDGHEGALIALGAVAPVTARSDADGDGVPDWIEALRFSGITDPNSPRVGGSADTDGGNGPAGDGISDALEDVLVALGTPAPVTAASDTDGDGLSDVLEIRTGTNPYSSQDPLPNRQIDVDGDGAPDYLEILANTDPLDPDDPVPGGAGDADGDRIKDGLQGTLALLGSAPPVGPTTDTDGDGLYDVLEVAIGSDFLDPSSPVAGGGDDDDSTGPAGDGISDALELYLIESGATAPVTRATDQDGDGVPDYLEAEVGSAVFDPDQPVVGGGADSDGDKVTDALEVVLAELGAPTPIDQFTDSDGDLAPDYLEVRAGSLPFDATDPAPGGSSDSDGDRISDGLEATLVLLGAAAPVTPRTDSDLDSIPDYLEITVGGDPFSSDDPVVGGGLDVDDSTGPAGDTVRDGLEKVLVDLGVTPPVDLATDSDGDGAPDYLEVIAHQNFFDPNEPVVNGGVDSDGDSMSDAFEATIVLLGGTAPIDIGSDTDGDGAPDYFERRALGNPVDATHPAATGANDGDTDNTFGPAGDGISDALEKLLFQLGSPLPIGTASDGDVDGLPDYLEVRIGTDPFDPDDPTVGGGADTNDSTGPGGDGISDALEAYLIANGATGPITTTTDTDGDGVPDWIEIYEGSDPFDAQSTPKRGTRPRAENVAVLGPFVIGRPVTGTYDYVDDDGDPEGPSTYQWFRNGVILPGETAITYTLTLKDLASQLDFQVIPVSNHAYPANTATGFAATGSVVIPVLDYPLGKGGPGGVSVADGTGALQLWLRADIGTVTSESNGESKVSMWRDLSGHGRDAVLSGTAPALVEGVGPAAADVIRFDTDSLQVPRPVQDDFTLFVAFSTKSSAGNLNWFQSPGLFGGEVPGSVADYHMGVDFGQPLFVSMDIQQPVSVSVDDGIPHAYQVDRVMATGQVEQFVDGTSYGQSLSGIVSSLDAPDNLQVGAATSTGGFFAGDIYEMMAFDRLVTRTERTLLTNYEAARTGVTIANPLYGFAATHGQDVAGIGQDNFLDKILSAEGRGMVQFSNPSALSSGDYLFWGTDDCTDFALSTNAPTPYTNRLERTWALQETDGGAGNGLGTVDVRFRVNGLALPTDATAYALLLDTDLDFSNATVFTTGATYDATDDTISFTGLDPTGVTYFTLAFVLP